MFALTADHGATPYPELVARRAGRMPPPRYDFAPALAGLRSALRLAGVDTTAVVLEAPFVFADRAAFQRARVRPDSILARFASVVRSTPGIARVDRVRDLASKDTLHDVVTRRWMHMLAPDAGAEYVITPREGAYDAAARIAEHGTPYDQDARVPIIFWGRWFREGRFAERALVVDMAPTLARVADVVPFERLDGRVLEHALALPAARP